MRHLDVVAARREFDNFTPKQPDPDLHRELAHGWMLPMLLHLDNCIWGRWNYWARCYEADDELPPTPIPRLELLSLPHPATRRMLEATLNCIPTHSSWRTWSGWSYFDFFLDWMLFGLGHKGQPETPQPPGGCNGASDRLYQVFCLDAMLLWPHDYFGDLLCESSYGKQQGFYPTPHTICDFMVQMACDGKRDVRTETVLDPCVGTGRFLLYASNHSLRLYGMDIDATLCKATLVNGYCYVPWLVRPIPWLDPLTAELERTSAMHTAVRHMATEGAEPVTACASAYEAGLYDASLSAERLSNRMADSAPPHAQGYLADTEHDAEGQQAVAPLLKRRKRAVDPTQGRLF